MSDPMTASKGKDAASGLTLDGRKGLPVDLLFLTKSHPRETWPGNPGLQGREISGCRTITISERPLRRSPIA